MKKMNALLVSHRAVGLVVSLSLMTFLIFSASAEVIVSLTTDKDQYCIDELVEVTISATNTGSQPASFTFPTNQHADFEIRDERYIPIYLWSLGMDGW
ncbi:MAG: BsuPI-related putative proteinase inhibitor [bacterium]